MKILALTAVILGTCLTPLWSLTLRDVLKEHDFDYAPLSDLDVTILSPEISDSKDFFCAGYFVNPTEPEIHVVLFDRKRQQWFQTKVSLREIDFCFGSNAIMGIQFSKDFVHLETHINPSAGCTLIFSKELRFQEALYGWPLAIFDDDTVVYQNSEVHFTATHPAEISLYNPVTKAKRKIYPMKPYQAIRLRHIEKMKQLYSDDNWCREKNHPCDPESFDETIGDLEINNETDSLIFHAQFGGDDSTNSEDADESIIYVYRHVRGRRRIEYKEMLESDLKKQFGDHPLSDYLQPATLSQIFGHD